MVHRGGLETGLEKNKKEDFSICIADDVKSVGDQIYQNKIGESSPKSRQIKRSTTKTSPKSTPLPLSDHSISQSIVRVERSRFIKKKGHPNSKADSGAKSTRLSPVRAGLRSNSLESHTNTNSNSTNAKAKKKKITNKKANTKPIECSSHEAADEVNINSDDSKIAKSKLSKQLPFAFVCSVPLDRLSGILESLKVGKTSAKCLPSTEEDTSPEDVSLNAEPNSGQGKELCLYCDKRMSTVKVRARHVERFHTISKDRRSSTRNPVIPSQDSKESVVAQPVNSSASSSSSPLLPKPSTSLVFNGCSFCSKSPKLQAVALENDLSALFYHLVDLHSDKYFGCKICAIRFQNALKLGDHVQRIHAQSNKSTPQAVDAYPTLSPDEEHNSIEGGDKLTPTKARRQLKQTGTESTRLNFDSFSPPSSTAPSTSSSIGRNGPLFSNDEPFLSRLGVTQNRLPRGRKGIRSRRQTNIESVKPDSSLMNVKTRSKVGRVCTSNEPIETVFRTPTNTRTEPLSCTFDEDFYEKVFINVRTNLSCHLDGKLGKDLDTNRPQSPPALVPAICSTLVKSPNISESEVHTATSLTALTAFPTLLTAEQYGCDLGTTKIKRPITKHSWKWKWDSVKKYKYVNEGGKIVKKIKQPMLGLRDLSKLDMWTQLTMRQKHELLGKHTDTTISKCPVEQNEISREEKQKQIDQLNSILDSRWLPQIILEQNEQTVIKLEVTDEGLRYLASELSSCSIYEEPNTNLADDRVIPASLNLIPSRSFDQSTRRTVVLSGEWARPRCYVCFGCGARFDKLKALEEHKMFRHPHVYSTHYEIVGRELIEGNLYKHFFIPTKALTRHREYAQGILVNKKTEDSVVSKSSSNSGNEEESLDSLHSVTASFMTLSSSKLSDDCDTDTKTAIENVSSSLSYAEPLAIANKNDNTPMVLGSFSVDCTKCSRNCHGVLELYRHMLDCSGDYAWLLAKKKKYRYYGSRRRRQFNKHNISTLHLHKRKMKEAKDENESDGTPKKKSTNMSPITPRPRPSDAESIKKMLENLPPKRVCREIIPNATKPRSRKFKTTGARKLQQNPGGKCKSSKSTLTVISKKLLRNHKLRAISDKDKISRSNKILENKRKSARIRGRIFLNKKPQPEKQTNKKTDTGNDGIVRKIGATTKRFVKKIKKRILGQKESATDDNIQKNIEKKPTKLAAVRKLTFDKDQDDKNDNKSNNDNKQTPSKVLENVECSKNENQKERTETPTLEHKDQLLPTINIETELKETVANENTCSISEENLRHQQRELSTSTEDLRKSQSLPHHIQVSPTTKRRSKKINDCIAMLTGKLQEKLGKPFLECKETPNDAGSKIQANAELSTGQLSNDIKDAKHPKRKAFTRRIVKCDPPTEPSVTRSAPTPAKETPIKVKELPIEEDRVKEVLNKESPVKEAQIKGPPVEDVPVKEPAVKDIPVKEPPAKNIPVKEPPAKNIPVKELPVNDIPVKEPPLKEPNVKDTPIKEHPSKKSPLKELPVKETLVRKTMVEDHIDLKATAKALSVEALLKTEPILTITPVARPALLEYPNEMESFKPKGIPEVYQQVIPVPVPTKNTVPSMMGSVGIATLSTSKSIEIQKKLPADKKQPPPKQQCIISADTIRVPCIKPPPLTIPQFNPAQIPTPRGMITKRRQTIAGAPNDFLTEMHSLRSTNNYNNLPFELEVPLDLSKKPKRSSPKSKSTTKAYPINLPQISVKPNAVLMPPIPFTLPILPQTQIIPILCESLQPKVSQIPLQSPPLIFNKESSKLVENTPRRRTVNNKKQETNLNVNANPVLTNMAFDSPPTKKSTRKLSVAPERNVEINLTVSPPKSTILTPESTPSVSIHPVTVLKLIENDLKVAPHSDINNQRSDLDKNKKDSQVQNLVPESMEQILLVKPLNSEAMQCVKSPPTLNATPEAESTKNLPEPEIIPIAVEVKETKPSPKANKKSFQPPAKIVSSPPTSIVSVEPSPDIKQIEPIGKIEKTESSPDSQKSIPTRRSRRIKVSDQSDQKPIANDIPPSTLREVEEIAASFLSDEENETTVSPPVPIPVKLKDHFENINPSEVAPKTKKKSDDKPQTNSEHKELDVTPIQTPTINMMISPAAEELTVPNNQEAVLPNSQDSNKKPRRRRKNELAAIVADQLMESFKEVDKSRLDDLKKLENLAYEKSEDLLITGMRLMPTTKRKNVLENKKETNLENEAKITKEGKKHKQESTKEKPSKIQPQKEEADQIKESKDIQKVEEKAKLPKEDLEVAQVSTLIGKNNFKTKLLPMDFGSYRTNSPENWSHRETTQNNLSLLSPENEKLAISNDVMVGVAAHKKSKKKQTKKRDKKIEIENINQLRTGLESFTLSKDAINNVKEDAQPIPRATEAPLSMIGLFASVQRNSDGKANRKETEAATAAAFGSLTNIKSSSSILRPSILAASLDISTAKENPAQSERKSSISSRDPRLNKNIHTEETDQAITSSEPTSRLATLRQRRKSLADANTPTNTPKSNARSTSNKRGDLNARRNSLAFDDDDDDNYLTAIAKRVNDKIMSAEDKDFTLANDGFDLANSFLDLDDPFGRPSTSMSVRSAPNLNEDRSNMDTMDATNTDLIDMDVDDDMSVYTTFSQDTSRSKGRRRRRRRSVLLTRKPKKTNINHTESTETYDCLLCNKKFAKPAALSKHQLTIAHVSKVSEQEYLNATKKREEIEQVSSVEVSPAKPATPPIECSKQSFTSIQNNKLEEHIIPPKIVETVEKFLETIEKPSQPKVPYLPPNSILNQSGIEPISSPEQNYERYSTKTSSRLTLNPDQRLFYECCNILKGSETPLVERTYPIVPPTTYAYDLQVKPVTPKSANERFSYIKQSTAEACGKRESGTYPRIDVNQFSDISSDSNPACGQPPPILPVNYSQMHVLSGAKDQAVLPTGEGDGAALPSAVARGNSVLQMSSLTSPNAIVPLTARTFVNQPSQIGVHLHGMETAATVTQKQNFISPLHSASSQSSTVTTTTCRLKTKAAMKGYDNLKVSIPTMGLDMEHALERSPRAGCKLTTLAEIALGNETPMTGLTSFSPAVQMQNDQKSKSKTKPTDELVEQFPSLITQTKADQSPPTEKKREKSPIKECSPIASVHDSESCMPIVLNPPKKRESILPKDIYEFDDSENTPISKAIQSPFKTADDTDGAPKKAIVIPERPFKNIGMEEQEGIKFQKPETPAINDDNTTSTVTYSDRDDFVYGSISGGDEDNEVENEDNKDGNMDSSESSNSSAFTAKTFENKSLIMGRIFKNAKTKPKVTVEKPKLPTPEPPKQIPKQELDRLFDTLRGFNEKGSNATKEERMENASNASRTRDNQTVAAKRKSTANAKTQKNKANTNKANKRAAANKEEHCSKEIARLHAELGMSPAEIAELIGEGQRKSQRRCAVNRSKKLVEIWSSDEFEEFLSTKDIIALIEEKEQKTKKKRKTTASGSKRTNPPSAPSNNAKETDASKAATDRLQSKCEKPESSSASPQKNLKNNSNTDQTSTRATTENPKKSKPTKGKKKVPTSTANIMSLSKPPNPKTQKELKSSKSRSNSVEVLKNNSSPFKKPTQRNIPLKPPADDSESDFEAELNRRSKGGPIRNRRKTISGKLESNAASTTSTAKKDSGKSKVASERPAVSRNASSAKATASAEGGQMRPQSRRKRIASEMLYYWSSSSDEEFGRIESNHDDEDHIDESENYQQHGWIVGDSHKKLVTLLAIAKGNKKVDDCGVKEINSKKKS